MDAWAWMNLALFMGLLLLAAWPLSRGLSAVAAGDLPRWMRRVEAPIYRLAGVNADEGMHWKQYALGLLLFSFFGVLAVYGLQRWQDLLPLNPQGMAAIAPDSAFNTAISFVTNTNWQGYGGESSMSYLTQMLALTVQNFVSAATGIAVVFALIRGFSSKAAGALAGTVGNFWADLTRITLWVLLPLSLLLALAMVGQGVIQNFDTYKEAKTLETQSYAVPKLGADGQPQLDAEGKPLSQTVSSQSQTLAMGPVASQLAIKMLGTNGGGFFNANSAHPFENPTPLSNLLQMLAIFLIPAALCFSFGRMVGDSRQGVAILAAMSVLFIAGVIVATGAEQSGNPALTSLGVDQSASARQSGGNMEGKEARFGINASSLFAVITTAASCGAVNSMHDSMTPIGGLVPLVMMQLGEVVFGGVGTGLYGMLVFAILAVFIAGLMIGRTPEYLGKKIEAYEMKMVSIAILVTPLVVLMGTALARAQRGWPGRCGQSGRPWLQRDPVRPDLGRQQQRQCLRRPVCQHALLQHLAGCGDVAGPLRRHRARAGFGRQPGGQEAHPGQQRHLAHPWPAVCRPADRHGVAGGLAQLRSIPGPRPHRRAPAALEAVRVLP